MDISGTDCARARESVSADLDSELHELDQRRLRAHLRVCADCSAWAEQVRAATAELRDAPLEACASTLFELPRRGRTWRVGPALAVAPALALVASVVVALGGQHGPVGGRPTTSTSLSSHSRHVVHDGGAVGVSDPSSRHWLLRAI